MPAVLPVSTRHQASGVGLGVWVDSARAGVFVGVLVYSARVGVGELVGDGATLPACILHAARLPTSRKRASH